jgi:hypothetical protein
MVAKLPYGRKEATPKISEKRLRLWNALHDFIRENGGWLVSTSGMKQMRIEARQGSSLPAKLIELGYEPRHCGQRTRTGPDWLCVEVIEIDLSGR